MLGSGALINRWVPEIATFAAQNQSKAEIVLCPPALFIEQAVQCARGSFLRVGGQDCSPHAEGAYTGEMSATMLKEVGCGYVIVGHSERRQYHGETNETVKAKANAAIAAGLVPVICIGETLAEREAGKAFEVIDEQLSGSLPTNHESRITNPHFLLAYEPVWAIGSGLTPTIADIEAMHAHIKTVSAGAKIVYGGSVKASNAQAILAANAVDGVLVGGASLKTDEFCGIIAASEE